MSQSDPVRVSIIIPMFNSERHIAACLDSLAFQIREGAELIIVDDGSTDQSVQFVANRYQPLIENSQIRIIKMKNSGPGAARNRGVEASTADYVGFVDSDDVVEADYFDTILYHLAMEDVDLVQFNYKTMSRSRNASKRSFKSHRSVGRFNLKEVRNEIFGIGKWFPVTRIYKREIMLKFPFVENVFYEDLITVPYIFMEDLEIRLIEGFLYVYINNSESTTSNHKPEHARTLWNFFMELTERPQTMHGDMLIVHVGRAISYFAAELEVPFISTSFAARIISNIPQKFLLLNYLAPPERLLLFAPRLYIVLDRVRLYKRRRKRYERL